MSPRSFLPTITAEINAYKRVAGEAIFEIGRRLKHVKENDLTHGQWERWCREEAGFDPATAFKFIRVYNELGGANLATWQEIGWRALYEIATLPPEERERPHTIPSTGATKTVDEMTEMPDASNAHIRRTINFVIKRKKGRKPNGFYSACLRPSFQSVRSFAPLLRTIIVIFTRN